MQLLLLERKKLMLYLFEFRLKLEKERLEELEFFEISHEQLPDVIAYSENKNWLYLIEAVHSSGPISELRLIQLEKLIENCTADIVYITSFSTRPNSDNLWRK